MTTCLGIHQLQVPGWRAAFYTDLDGERFVADLVQFRPLDWITFMFGGDRFIRRSDRRCFRWVT